MKPEIAYEVHSCLVDALQTGTGSIARQTFGLGQFPAAGKTGTAYDFTEAVFAGYDSAITCAVRAGFDKPQKIYRGAFGREIALPVWVDIMNASIARHPPKEIAKPAALQAVEICSKSGLLATDKCGDSVYREFATKEQIPTDPCSVHGDPRARIVRDLPDAGVPRASLAVDTAQVKPVQVRGPTVLAENDPYNAVKSTAKPPEPPEEEIKAALPVDPKTKESPGEEPILRAQPVEPRDREGEPEIRRAEPVRRALPVDPLTIPRVRSAEPRPEDPEDN
jgi:membrane peptidoglycan carboxypeptidase